MEEAKGVEIEPEMAAEAEKATMPGSGLRRRRNEKARDALPSTPETLSETMDSQMLPWLSTGMSLFGLRSFRSVDLSSDYELLVYKPWSSEILIRVMSSVDPFRFITRIDLKGIEERLYEFVWQRGRILLRIREQRSLHWMQTSSPVVEMLLEGGESSSTRSLLEISQLEMLPDGGESRSTSSLLEISDIAILLDGGESSSTIETTEWTLLMANVLMECASAIFDQLGYVLLGMVMAFVALVLSTIDLFLMGRKEKITWDGRSSLPCFIGRSNRDLATREPFGTIVQYFGFFGAVWQSFFSTMAYVYARQNKDNPIKMSLLPFIFLMCVIVSKRKIKEAQRSD